MARQLTSTGDLPGGTAASLALLLRLRIRSAYNAASGATPAHKWIGGILAAGSALLFTVIFLAFAALLLGVGRSQGVVAVHALIGETDRYLFLFLLAGAVPFVSGVLFAPGDLPLLASTPIQPSAIIMARLFDAVVIASAQFIVIGVPLLVACGWALHMSLLGWLGFAVLLLTFLALPALLIAALLLLFARLVGLRRVRAVVAVASALSAVAICLLMVSSVSQRSAHSGSNANDLLAATTSLHAATASTDDRTPYLPSTWMTASLIGLGNGDIAAALPSVALLIGCTALLVPICLIVGGPVLTGDRILEGDADTAGSGAARRLKVMLALIPFSPPVKAILVRDLLYTGRDLVLLSQLGIPLILFLVPFVIEAQVGGGAASGDMANFSLCIVGVIAFMETSILSLSSVGLEGRGFWMVISAPITSARLLRAKWAGACGGSLAVTIPLLVFTCIFHRLPVSIAVLGLAILIVICATLCGLGVGISGMFPRFVYENPAHRASIAALIWGFVGSTLYVLVAGIPLGAALYLAPQTPEWSARILGGGVGWFLVVSLATGLVPLQIAGARLRGYAWEE